ncbi:hypothetical protein BDV96DRAFT_387653 [Lophiotrema nucula]|uniref:Uncharacterized protein n=1 Tax=Lophiotrema nucula TaxID=690887 RepID=A0A6A5ZHZ0_9PLEO|nr:hypothetical protein BDV96DRAFT_387653 [Lophiotrema nucula]
MLPKLLVLLLLVYLTLAAPLTSPPTHAANLSAKDTNLCSFHLKWTQYCDFKMRNHLSVPSVFGNHKKDVTYDDNQFYPDLQPGDRFKITGLASDVGVELVRACGRDDGLQLLYQNCTWQDSGSGWGSCGHCESGEWDKEGDFCTKLWDSRVKQMDCYWNC